MNNKSKREITLILITVVMSALLALCLAVDAPGSAEVTILQHAQTSGLTLQDYPQNLIDLLERNPETKDFVLNYPTREEQAIDLSGLDLTQGVPQLLQWDQRWGYMEYAGDLVGDTGSGPLCLSMVGYYLTGDTKFYPDRMVRYALRNHYDEDGGSKWSLISQGGKDLGLTVKELAPEEKKIAAYVNSGSPIIAVIDAGDHAAVRHFIVLTGYADGKLMVNDPDSYVNSTEPLEFAAIKDQLLKVWVIGREIEG